MSFRTRLTSFFVLIVVVPMLGVGFLVFRLISDSSHGKADARANGIAASAVSLYQAASASARSDARTIAGALPSLEGPDLKARISALALRSGLARVTITVGHRTIVDVGDRHALAPGFANVVGGSAGNLRVTVSTLSASEFVRELSGVGVAVVVRQGAQTLASSVPARAHGHIPTSGQLTVAGVSYRAVTVALPAFGGGAVQATILSNLAEGTGSVGTTRAIAAVFIAGFLLLAFSFSVLASRALQGQLGRFLEAARRLAGGDFSSPVPTEGHDEFAALGTEFNNMSEQLARRLDELQQERARLRDSIRRIGQTFAANLDRPALLNLALQTAVDAVEGDCGRLSVRAPADGQLAETSRIGSLDGFEPSVLEAERVALRETALAEATVEGMSVAAIPIGPLEEDSRAIALITVGRRGKPFSDDDRELLRSLAAQATLAVDNVELHYQVRRQAVTDELTGLPNHGRFQDRLSSEIEQVRRYHYPLGLIMLDIDNFKKVNDTYGHQQGDLVLKQVARVLRETSREADTPARYGGEEMALILPHTDLEGAYAIAERLRTAISSIRVPRLDQQGMLRVTASLGVAASTAGEKDALIADADAALYVAKRQGKNRTIRAVPETANVFGAE